MNPFPLSGLKVLDFTSMIAGPFCTRGLADMGCDVIKIEAPEGDYIRQREPLREGFSAYFGHLNAGKRSVMLDLRDQNARSAVRKMVEACDIIVENMRPGAMQRLGLGYEQVRGLNPSLIYCSISGFGQTGPDAERPVYAPIVQAASGFETASAKYQRGAVSDRPLNITSFVADILGGTFAMTAIMAALHSRNLSGTGQFIDTSLFESMLQLMPYEVQEAQFPAKKLRPVYRPLKANDGYLMIAAISPRNFEALFNAIGMTNWQSDPVLNNEEARQMHWDQVMEKIEKWTCARSSDECVRYLSKAGVPITRYQTVQEAINCPQSLYREVMQKVKDDKGDYLVPNLPFKLSESEISVGKKVPALGEHTYEVLSTIARLDVDEVKAIRAVRQ
jgi:CoA:oxalate CoA-transferase